MRLRFRLGPFTFGKGGTRLSPWKGGSGVSVPLSKKKKGGTFDKVRIGSISAYFGGVPWRGETLLKSFLLDLPTNQYKTFHNVFLATPDGSTQIDHVIISIYGVFVIETKDMTGWIFGAKDQSRWTQIIFQEKFRFQNPLRQNYKHTLSLAKALNIPHDHVFSVVAFVGDSTFKTPMPPNVTHGYDCVRYIKQHNQELFSLVDVHLLVDLLEQKQLPPTAETERQHIEHVQNIAVNKTICTRCGKPMVERVAKKGANAGQTFLGCSGYPNCKNTVELPS